VAKPKTIHKRLRVFMLVINIRGAAARRGRTCLQNDIRP
jgi:hypothetical protein